MTRLRDALSDLAEEAPAVSLAEAAVAVHRRRRTRRLAMTTVAAVTALAATTAGAVAVWPQPAGIVATQRQDVPDLTGKAGAIRYAYQTPCEVDDVTRHFDCSAVEWRVVTQKGTYRLPRALTSSKKDPRVPVAISRDGRRLAYYSRDAGAHVIRDMTNGEEVVSPVKVAEERIGAGSMLAISDDGRYLAFDPGEGSKEPGLLIDVRTGRTRSIPGVYEVVGIKDGAASLIRYRKTDLWVTPVKGGGKPVRFDGVFIMFSELDPDGRTVVAVEFDELKQGRLTVLDARTGRTLRKVSMRGLPPGDQVDGTGIWLNRDEVTVLAGSRKLIAYALDVTTGRTRRLASYGIERGALSLPGVNQQFT